MKHTIKIDVADFNRIKNKEKTYINCSNKDNIQKGDDLVLVEWNNEKINVITESEKGLTGETMNFKAGFVESNGKMNAIVSLLSAKSNKKDA